MIFKNIVNETVEILKGNRLVDARLYFGMIAVYSAYGLIMNHFWDKLCTDILHKNSECIQALEDTADFLSDLRDECLKMEKEQAVPTIIEKHSEKDAIV